MSATTQPLQCSGQQIIIRFCYPNNEHTFSYTVLNDDKPHAIQLLLEGKNLTMKVDGGLSRSLINDGPRDKLSVARSTFLGGVPRETGEAAIGQWHLRNSTSLKGEHTSIYCSFNA